MKPLKLIMSAFGPYADEVVIDMTKLGERGIYLVTGDTGGIFRQAYDLGVFRVISKMSSQSELKYTVEEFLSLQNVRQDEHDNVHQKKHFKLFGNRKHKIKKGKNLFIK